MPRPAYYNTYLIYLNNFLNNIPNFLRTGGYRSIEGRIVMRLTDGYWWTNASYIANNFMIKLKYIGYGDNSNGLGYAIRCVVREG